MASLTDTTSHPTLLFYLFGDESIHVTNTYQSLQSKKEKDHFLVDFFKPYYSRLPHYSEEDPGCKPTACVSTDWLHDELAGFGSYSNFQVGLADGDRDIAIMREGIPEGGLWFAGEHTAPFVGLGTSTGAYWSGQRAAKDIAEVYGRFDTGSVNSKHREV
jgi:hypothetical protein